MLSFFLQCPLVALCILLALGEVTGQPLDSQLSPSLQKSLTAAREKRELAQYYSPEALSEPHQTEKESEDAKQAEAMRQQLRPSNLLQTKSPPKKKTNCRKIFWKTWAPC